MSVGPLEGIRHGVKGVRYWGGDRVQRFTLRGYAVEGSVPRVTRPQPMASPAPG